MDRASIRVAALMHDIGHGPLSHVTEDAVRSAFENSEYSAILGELLRFEGATKIAPAELVAVLMVLSNPMRTVFEHANFSACAERSEFAFRVAARILGSCDFLDAGYLSGILSGPLDADKLDYMARDSHHVGLPVALDLDRLISKLEVVIITADNAPNDELRSKATSSPRGRLYDLGISLAGVGAYEQSVIARVILYDRLYQHQKIRTAESMARRLIRLAEENRQRPITISELYTSISDEAFIDAMGAGTGAHNGEPSGGRSRLLADRIASRELHYRAFAFAARFLPLQSQTKDEQIQARILIWGPVLHDVTDRQENWALTEATLQLAKALGQHIEELRAKADEIKPDDIIIELPNNKAVVRGNDIHTRTESGHVAVPNLFFDPESWSKAYEHQKLVGFVFTRQTYRPLVALAARIIFYERFQVVTSLEGEKASKTVDLVKPEWVTAAQKVGLCSAECARVIVRPTSVLARFRPEQLPLPIPWRTDAPQLAEELAVGLNDLFPAGLSPSTVQSVYSMIGHLAGFIDMVEKGGNLDGPGRTERDLQQALRDHLRSRGVSVQEGTECGGGETDLLVEPGPSVVEMKLAGSTDEPFRAKPGAPWQARRYSISLLRRISFLVIGYQPASEVGIGSITGRIKILQTGQKTDMHACIAFAVPIKQQFPSRVRPPIHVE